MSLSIRDLRARYPGRSWELGPLNVEVPPDQILGVIGPNGSGKSTLFRVLVGDLRPREGDCTWNGESLLSMSAARRARRLAWLPQQPSVAFDFPVEQVVRMGQFARPDPSEKTLEWALDLCQVRELRTRPIHQLSGGEKKRVFLARALVQQPELLILDEPTASLDLKYGWQLPTWLERARRRRGTLTVLWAMHDLELASRVAERLLLLEDGRQAAHGTVESVLSREHLGSVYGVRARVESDRRTRGLRILPDD